MARKPTWGTTQDARLVELHARGYSCSRVAREMGYARSTIGTKAKAMGLKWVDHVPVEMVVARKQAVEWARDEAAEHRFQQMKRMQELAESVIDRYTNGGKVTTWVKSKGGGEESRRVEFDELPVSDLKTVFDGLGRFLSDLERIEQGKVTVGKVEDFASSALGRLATTLGERGVDVEALNEGDLSTEEAEREVERTLDELGINEGGDS